jgi:hypothetical protein
MNWKLIFVGGVVYYAAQFIVGMGTGGIVHNGILVEAYRATTEFWRPELNQVPPDTAALMPRWIATGLIAAFLSAAVYGWIRPALAGPGWQKGLKFGGIVVIVSTCCMLGWSGVFGLPERIWFWWWVESLAYFLIGGAVLGWYAEKYAPAC